MTIFRHQSVGSELTRLEWESDSIHVIGDDSAGDVLVVSQPPPGKCKIVNVFWDPDTKRAVFEYEDVPI